MVPFHTTEIGWPRNRVTIPFPLLMPRIASIRVSCPKHLIPSIDDDNTQGVQEQSMNRSMSSKPCRRQNRLHKASMPVIITGNNSRLDSQAKEPEREKKKKKEKEEREKKKKKKNAGPIGQV
ncbi:uncharacterized protein BO66DRAFT_44949 [Aspergillus aculeatinus CBS 121060]|uniref:Uncharacterized protein n=1 Tax=Aspergillus aculeatinus CBS 121060 TaxID=1448322 RepID=A0ACD1HER6_9EURO|nr:hypothetical protein BO66DRAFT_44949 [Aspergillus aculeatinus CBS 121060]RAH72004.1 hypothetical protein BO66DRAFT_44949 [Aspergillus aculeatinus CBS 121060]